jgi:hypothetical protein
MIDGRGFSFAWFAAPTRNRSLRSLLRTRAEPQFCPADFRRAGSLSLAQEAEIHCVVP